MANTLLYLDDSRNPAYESIGLSWEGELVWVKSVEEFADWIDTNGLPEKISFDYNLGKGLDMYNDGIGAAKHVIRYCVDNTKPFPIFEIHSTWETVYDLNNYIVRNIDLYDLGEVRQEGVVHKKPEKNPAFSSEQAITISRPHFQKNTSDSSRINTPVKKIAAPNRNDACSCGSGKKYKRCCINK